MKLLALLLLTGCADRFEWPSRAEQDAYNSAASRATGIPRSAYHYVPRPTNRQIALANDQL